MGRGSVAYASALVVASALSATQVMAVDPVKQWYAFVGGAGVPPGIANDEAAAIAVDPAGGVYVVGSSTLGAWGPDWDSKLVHGFTDRTDVLVAKLTPDGKPAWYTFLGNGQSDEWARGVAVGGAGLLYVAGDGPTATWSADQCLANSGTSGGFLVQLNSDTGQCVRRTFIVDELGNPFPVIHALAVDANGNPYVAGKQNDHPCVAKLDPDGTVAWRACVESWTGEAFAIAVDGAADPNVYVTGQFYYPAQEGGGTEPRPFVAVKAAGSSMLTAAPIGPTYGVGRAIALDAAGAMYVAGDVNSMQTFVKKVLWQGGTIQVDPKEWKLREATSEDRDVANGIVVHSNGGSVDVYAIGTTSGDGPFQESLPPFVERNPPNHPSETEAWVVRLDANLDLTWWTFMGSENPDPRSAVAQDVGTAVALDGSGDLYALGQSTLPWPESSWGSPMIDHSPGGSWDFYVVRFDAGAGACPPEDACVGNPCLAKRAQDWGTYVSCVEAGLAEHYLGKPYRAYLNGCRDAYFKQWKSCLGSRFEDNGDSVTDKLTALVWEKKTGTVDVDRPYNEFDVHDVNNKFSWSTSSATGPWLETGTAFRTFLADLNKGEGFDESNGWRVPTIAELQTLMRESGDGVLAEFPNVTSTGGYWSATSSPYVEGNCTTAGQCAWNVIFENDPGVLPLRAGSVPTDGKDGGRHVRAVRGGW